MKAWSKIAREHVFERFRADRWRAPDDRWDEAFRHKITGLSGRTTTVADCERIARGMAQAKCREAKKNRDKMKTLQANGATGPVPEGVDVPGIDGATPKDSGIGVLPHQPENEPGGEDPCVAAATRETQN